MAQPMTEAAGPIERVLKQNPNRTVSLEGWREADRVVGRVVKRFHGTRLGDRLLDRFRARREWRSLVALHRAGLPVPEPVEVRRGSGGWEVVTTFVDGAVTLRRLLDDGAPWPRTPEELARPFARLLAATLGAGLEHTDLHAGNVLVDPRGGLWLVDVGHSRLHPGPSAARVEAALVQLAAETRERVPCGTRLRVLCRFLSAVPDALRSELGPARELAGRIETRARLARRQGLADDRSRWTRASSSVRRAEIGGQTGWTPCSTPDGLLEVLAARLPDAGDGELIELPDGCAALVLAGRTLAELRSQWSTTGLLFQHGIACARPLWLAETPRPLAAFALPAGATPLTGHAPSDELAHALGWLFGSLHDRRLATLISPDAVLWSPGIGAALCPPLELRASPDGTRPSVAPGIEAWTATREHRAAYVQGFLAAQRGGVRERAGLAEEWARG